MHRPVCCLLEMLEHAIGDLVERCGTFYAADPALVHGNRRLTHGEMLAAIRRTGRALLNLGVEPGERVGILMKDSAELAAVYYGALWAGLVVVPLNARLGAEDHAYILQDAGVRVLCHDVAYAQRADDICREAGVELTVCAGEAGVLEGGHELDRLTSREADGPGQPDVAAAALCAIYYTGGTTGRPKGVAHSHRTMVAAMVSEMLELGLRDGDVFGHVAPLTHASGLFVLPTWLRGAANVLLGGFDPEQLLDAVERERVSTTFLVPTMIYVLLDAPALAKRDTSSLQTVLYGAAPMGKERLLQGIDALGPVFVQLYGQTEIPNQLCVLRKSEHAAAVATGDHEPLTSCGRPVTMAQVRLAGEGLEPVAPGEVGEITARGPHRMLEYWNRPEETAETIRDGWLCTGDLARADERGFIYIVDRKKDMIISGGFNVYPKEVEQTLFAHPAVRDVCVIGVPDEKWGEAVKAVVVAHPGADADENALIAFVKEHKGSVLAPKSVDFVDEIPLTAVGKHDKPTLRAAYWQGRERAVN